MKTLVLDFETYWSQTYKLTLMPTLAYIRHPEFLIHGAAVKEDHEKAKWIWQEDLEAYFETVPWDEVTLIGHHVNFDFTVLKEKFGRSAKHRVDTLAVCRMLLSHDLDFDLGAIAQTLGIGTKGKDVAGTLGVRDVRAQEALAQALAAYACVDAELEYGIYVLLFDHLTAFQKRLMNSIIRMSTEGTMLFDAQLALESKVEIDANRRAKAEFVGLQVLTHPDRKTPWVPQLTSSDRFAELLQAKGVTPPRKLSAKTGKMAWAFSKQDPDFVKLQADPEAAPLVAARMAWSSNNELTRIDHLISITRTEPFTLPVQLNVSGAHTHRKSGGGGINEQNLNRGSKLRQAHRAPKGYVLVVVDASQIELRINMALSGQKDKLAFLTPGLYVYSAAEIKWHGGDLYRLDAASAFHVKPEAVDKKQRGFGKVRQLGCGYQMGARRFRVTCAIGPFGVDPIYIDDDAATRAVYGYRIDHPMVKASWDWNQYEVIPVLAYKGLKIEKGPLVIEHGEIKLPNGVTMQYPDVRASEEGEWVYGINNTTHKLFGGKLQENEVQALAGIFIDEKMLEIEDVFDGEVLPVHQVHDEIICLCPEARADEALRIMVTDIMSKSPSWMPELPVRAEGGYAESYSK